MGKYAETNGAFGTSILMDDQEDVIPAWSSIAVNGMKMSSIREGFEYLRIIKLSF